MQGRASGMTLNCHIDNMLSISLSSEKLFHAMAAKIRGRIFCLVTSFLRYHFCWQCLRSCRHRRVGLAILVTWDEQLGLFLDWFPGEYDNYEQSWQDGLNEVAQPHEHIHHIFAPVSASAIGDHIFFVQQYMDGNPANIYRQRLYSLTTDTSEKAIRLTIFSFKDEDKYRDAHLSPAVLKELQSSELVERPGCEVYWRFNPEQDYFEGYMHEKACSFVSQRSGKKIYITDDLRLTANEIWIRDEAFDESGNRVFGNEAGIHHKNRKVRYFTGWGGFKKAGRDAVKDRPEDEWFFARDILIHNEGQIVSIPDDAGNPSGYSVQLALLTCQDDETSSCQGSTASVLKLGLIEDATGETLVYSWANPDAERIGINVRWAQVGLTLQSQDSEFGFDVDSMTR